MATTSALRRLLLELDAQIARQKSLLTELEHARSAAERELHATASFPILTLPVEITAEIFGHSLAPFDDGLSGVAYNKTVPFNVSRVCRAWRDIAVTTPQLWTTLRVSFDSTPGPDLVEKFIDLWLARAGTCPVSLICSTTDFYAIRHLRDAIRRCSDRVEYLCIHITRGIGELELNSVTFPVLQRATLSYFEGRHSNLTNTILSHAPRFHDLCCVSGVSPSRITLPWLQLTKFEGTLWDLDLFDVAPNLVEVQCYFDRDEDRVFAVVTHSHLRSLTLKGGCSGLIRYLSLPALRYLDVSKMVFDDYASLEPFLERSSSPLESLSVRADNGLYPDWHRCLPRIASTLKNLHVSHVPRDVMTHMLWRANGLLDCLEGLNALSFEEVDGGVDLCLLTEFLYSRFDKLRSFRLIWKDDLFLNDRYLAGPPNDERRDTISGHLSRIKRARTDIYLGTEDMNYAAIEILRESNAVVQLQQL